MMVVSADTVRNRLNLKIDQSVTESELGQILARVKAELARLKPGWVAAVDLRGVNLVDPKLKGGVEQVQAAMAMAKPSKVCSIFDSNILRMQLLQTANKAQLSSYIQRFDNELEWKRALDA